MTHFFQIWRRSIRRSCNNLSSRVIATMHAMSDSATDPNSWCTSEGGALWAAP